jgi:hypothetical protein
VEGSAVGGLDNLGIRYKIRNINPSLSHGGSQIGAFAFRLFIGKLTVKYNPKQKAHFLHHRRTKEKKPWEEYQLDAAVSGTRCDC